MDDTEMAYNVAIEAPSGQTLVNWGNEPGWMTTHRALLEQAHTISLIPKNGNALPLVTMRLEGDRRWVLFSRVYGRIGAAERVRLYCIGWQETVKGVNVKALLWIYPTGALEYAPEPTYWEKFLP